MNSNTLPPYIIVHSNEFYPCSSLLDTDFYSRYDVACVVCYEKDRDNKYITELVHRNIDFKTVCALIYIPNSMLYSRVHLKKVIKSKLNYMSLFDFCAYTGGIMPPEYDKEEDNIFLEK